MKIRLDLVQCVCNYKCHFVFTMQHHLAIEEHVLCELGVCFGLAWYIELRAVARIWLLGYPWVFSLVSQDTKNPKHFTNNLNSQLYPRP